MISITPAILQRLDMLRQHVIDRPSWAYQLIQKLGEQVADDRQGNGEDVSITLNDANSAMELWPFTQPAFNSIYQEYEYMRERQVPGLKAAKFDDRLEMYTLLWAALLKQATKNGSCNTEFYLEQSEDGGSYRVYFWHDANEQGAIHFVWAGDQVVMAQAPVLTIPTDDLSY